MRRIVFACAAGLCFLSGCMLPEEAMEADPIGEDQGEYPGFVSEPELRDTAPDPGSYEQFQQSLDG